MRLNLYSLLVVTLLCAARAWAAPAPRLAYVKDGALWVVAIDCAGKLVRGARPERLLALPRTADTGLALTASPDGRWLAVTFGADQKPATSLLIDLEAQGGGRARRLEGWDPAFSPRGDRIAYTGAVDGVDGVVVEELATGRRRLLRPHTEAPSWGGRRIAVAGNREASPDIAAPVIVVDAETGKQVYTTGAAVDPLPPMLSPDGRQMAFEFHLSRPVTGDSLVEVDTGADLRDPTPRGYLPGELVVWARDCQRSLWRFRVPDPENDGSWIGEDLRLVAGDGSPTRLLARGRRSAVDDPSEVAGPMEARFSPDESHVLWFQGRHDGEPGDLQWRALSGGPQSTLVTGVDAFAVILCGRAAAQVALEDGPARIRSRHVPKEFARAYEFLEFLVSPEPSPEGFDQEYPPRWDVQALLGYVSPRGVTFSDVNGGGLEGHRAPSAIRSSLTARRGAIFRTFAHLASIYSEPYRQYSELRFRRSGSRYIVSVGDWYDLTFVSLGGQLRLTRCDYTVMEDE